MTQALLCAYRLGTDQKVMTSEELTAVTSEQPAVWCHFDAGHKDTKEMISSLGLNIPDLVVNALIAEDTRPRFTNFDHGLLLSLRGVNMNENADPTDMVSIRIWSDGKHILTAQMRSLKAIRDMRTSIENGTGPDSPAAFISMLAQNLTYRIDPTIDSMEEDVDALEEHLLVSSDKIDSGDLMVLRRRTVMLTRHLVPQREALIAFVRNDMEFLKAKQRNSLNETLNQLNLYIEELDTLRQRLFLIKEEISTDATEKLNHNMYILSIIASIFLPLGFFTGLLGININGIPGADYQYAFYVFSGILTVIVILQYFLFKKKGWF